MKINVHAAASFILLLFLCIASFFLRLSAMPVRIWDESRNAMNAWSMYLNGKWYGLQLSPAATLPTGTVAMLDVSILQDRLLDPILGIKDIRTDKRVDFIGGRRGTKELERLVDEGRAAVAF